MGPEALNLGYLDPLGFSADLCGIYPWPKAASESVAHTEPWGVAQGWGFRALPRVCGLRAPGCCSKVFRFFLGLRGWGRRMVVGRGVGGGLGFLLAPWPMGPKYPNMEYAGFALGMVIMGFDRYLLCRCLAPDNYPALTTCPVVWSPESSLVHILHEKYIWNLPISQT